MLHIHVHQEHLEPPPGFKIYRNVLHAPQVIIVTHLAFLNPQESAPLVFSAHMDRALPLPALLQVVSALKVIIARPELGPHCPALSEQ